MQVTPTTNGIDYEKIDSHLHRRVRAAEAAEKTKQPSGERVSCPCGYSGPPEVIVQYSEWDDNGSEYDLLVCPNCGGA